MRARNLGATARLLLIGVLALGTALSGLSWGVPGTTAPDTPIVQGRGKVQKQQAKNPGQKQGATRGQNQGKKHNKNKHKNRNKKVPAALDAQRIVAENAATVDAFDCEGLTKVSIDGHNYCTHGEDPQLFGAGAEGQTPAANPARSSTSARTLCIGDGESGPRVQIVYVYTNNRADRLGELLPTFRRLASEMDVIVDQSARKTGGSLHIRFVTTNCQVDIASLSVPSNAIGDFSSLIQAMKETGYNRLDRKYLMLVDASAYCGVGTFAHADSKTTDAHDFTGYARIDKPCWDAGTMIHELGHTLGAVQYSAPHTSRGAHCIDEWDVMCYRDEPLKPKMKYLCQDGAGEFRLDCRDDDYFAAQPAPGSYLANHWNMADSIYFTDGSGEECVDAALEPDDAYWYDFWEVPIRKFTVGEREDHAFCEQEGDTDWILFEGERGKSYEIETTDLGPNVDTQLVLYRGFEEQGWDSMDQFGVNDDRAEGDPSSLIAFTSLNDGSYLIGVSEANQQAGLDKTYTFSIKEVPSTNIGPLSLSRPSAKPGGDFSATMSEVQPQADVTFWLQRNGEATQLGSATAADDGIATGNFTVPKGASHGLYQVEAIGTDSSIGAADLRVEKEGGRDGKEKKGKGHKGKKGNGRRGKH